jgi:GT2 family glycosyltransferase
MLAVWPGVSVFIPAWNDAVDLAACLRSLRGLRYPRERVEVVVWDNGSTDGTGDRAREAFDAMREEGWGGLAVLRSERNEGSYVPYNLAEPALAASTDYVLGLDADVEVGPDLLERLVAAARGERVAVVGARSVYFDRPERTAHGAGFVSRWSARYGERDPGEAIECDYVIGCCWLLDRRAFRAVGGFNPDFFINHWEVDYCLRAKRAGWRVRYEPRAVVRHKVAPGGTRNPERLYYMYRNKLLMIRTSGWFRYPGLAAGLCALLSAARIGGDALAPGRGGETRASVRGLLDGLRGRRGVVTPGRP